MTEQKIGAQLDELGLAVDLGGHDRIIEAVVTVTSQIDDGMIMHHRPVRVPTPELRPVPYPVEQRVITVVEANQVISEEQRQRLCAWLEANGIDPKFVSLGGSIAVHSRALNGKEGAYQIRYTEYCRDVDGEKFMDIGSEGDLTVQRRVVQKVPLGEDPAVTLP
ncbi:hypothetical protein [Streptomyces sp. NPDC088135]|uniref:hypothetical protein n=1 Tax=Streptomyces sp. NPDC088135 TaxID=3160993 RepID=UPI003435ED87